MSDRDVYSAANPATARGLIEQPAGAGNRVLWIGMFAPPFAWATDLLVSIAGHHDYCAALVGHTYEAWSAVSVLLLILGLAMLAVSLAAGFAAWRGHANLGSDNGRGNTDLDRRRFMARAGLLSSALFSYAIVLRIIAPMMIPAMWCS